MGHAYQAVGWNRQKKLYDFTLLGLVVLAVSVFGTITALRHPDTTAESFLIRFTAVTAFLLLHVILAIGPLARLDARFLPLLYNRRHLGVTMALLALVHGAFAIVQFHALGDRNPLVSVFTAYGRGYAVPFADFRAISQFPFEIFGFAALLILLVMAATSHDFWLHNLGPSVWKALHQLVYVAYALLLAHVLFGVFQSERSPVYPALLGLGFVVIVALHLLAARQESGLDRQRSTALAEGFFPVTRAGELRANEGKVVVVEGRRYALFVQDGRVFALSNVCRHQGGPVGEGRIVNGCVTCPWHGFQYKAEDGCSPPPFHETLPTYAVRLVDGTIYLSPLPLPVGTKSAGAPLLDPAPAAQGDFFIGWQSKMAPALARFARTAAIFLAVLVPAAVGAGVWFQHPVDRGRFEFGIENQFEGVLYERPIPRLRVTMADGRVVDHVLVGSGKFGPPAVIAGAQGHRVRFTGSLIVREPLRMIELNQPSTFAILDPGATPVTEAASSPLGQGRFVGELVDTKCFSGVMRPAAGKVHRGCAVRCLSGGVPPGLLVRDPHGAGVVFLLTGPGEEPLRYDVQLAGTLVEAEGALELHGDTPVLHVTHLTPK
ncbi:MAG: Rieske 2Fe-2S domain-containing protein [Chthoniobacter sp.]|uniref:Rieske 2Fe-2S domain-containing protein n=1 Tax=Chthoniobacter sp. TaxID=2510640 RepID=UPI0032A6CE79